MERKWQTDARRAIADVCHRLYERSYLVATSGNVSVRHDGGFLITPANTRKDLVTPELVVECDSNGKCAPGPGSAKPSSETAMHFAVYAHRKDIGAAIHAHPHYCLACSLADISLTEMLLPELAIYIGPVPLVPYATPGTDEMARALLPFLKDHNAFLLQRHGVLVFGKNLEDAFNRLEHLEHIAHVVYLVCSMSTIEPLTKTELRKLTEQARKLSRHISRAVLDLLE